MGLTNSTKIETNRYELEVTVDKDTFKAAVDKAFRKNAKKLNVPGFRKGKAPRPIIEKLYGESVFYDDAINEIYPEEYEAAVKEAGVEPVDRADVEVVSVGREGLVFKAKVTVKPEVEIGRYKGLKAEKKIPEVTDKDVETELSRAQMRNARLISVEDRAAQNGDIASIDFEGFVDGKAFKGGKAEKYNLELGSGQFIPGFEEQIVGHNIGDEFDVSVTFPEQYGEKNIAGKPAVFKVRLHEIKKQELPELDDEFAKDVSEFDTLEQYKEDIKKHITQAREKHADDEVENQLIDLIVAGMSAEIPQVMFERAIDNQIKDFDYRLQSQGLSLKQYLQYAGMEADKFRESFRTQAERQVKFRLALEKIASLENLAVSEEEVNDEIKKIAEQYGIDTDRVKSVLEIEDIEKDILANKAVQTIRSGAVISESKESGKKAAAKGGKKAAAPKVKAAAAGKDKAEKTQKKAEGKSAEKSEKPKTRTKKADTAKKD
jgi:trigger factor